MFLIFCILVNSFFLSFFLSFFIKRNSRVAILFGVKKGIFIVNFIYVSRETIFYKSFPYVLFVKDSKNNLFLDISYIFWDFTKNT